MTENLCLVSAERRLNRYFESAQFTHKYYTDITLQIKNRSAIKMKNHSKVTELSKRKIIQKWQTLSCQQPPPPPKMGGFAIMWVSKPIQFDTELQEFASANRLFQRSQAVTKPNGHNTSSLGGSDM